MLLYRKPKPKAGDTKTVTKFCLLPRFTEEKIVWLRRAELTYFRKCHYYGYGETFVFWELIHIE